MKTLTNGLITLSVKKMGAELCSLKKGDKEYLWQALPEFWNRHSPVLFPIVGSVWEGSFRIDGKEYKMGQHGFARDLEFELVEEAADFLHFRLSSNEESKKIYPYDFTLDISYRLYGNKVDVKWDVKNTGSEKMYFQIGAHPAFYFPDRDPSTKNRGIFEFDQQGPIEYILPTEKGCCDTEHIYIMDTKDARLQLDTSTFDIDTFVIENWQVKKVALLHNDGSPYLNMTFNAPVVGLWSPPKVDAPFVCIEPWYGRCDRVGFTGEFKDRDHVSDLNPDETFSTFYTIEIEE